MSLVPSIALAASIILAASACQAASARQETSFHVESKPSTVCRWIESHTADLHEAAGVTVLGTRGKQDRLRKETRYGLFEFIARRSIQPGHYRSEMAKSIRGDLTAHVTEIIVAADDGGSLVTIKAAASVDELAPFKIANGLRDSINGMRNLMRTTFER